MTLLDLRADDLINDGVAQLEALGGWDRGKGSGLEQLPPDPLWAPGSSVTDPKTYWSIKENGLWQLKGDGA